EHRQLKSRKSGDIATWVRKAFDPTYPNGIGGSRDDNRDRAGQLHEYWNDPSSIGDDDVRLQLHDIGRMGSHQVHVVRGPTHVELNVAITHPSEPGKLVPEQLNARLKFRIGWRIRHQ